ncbi:MAG: PQQ-dependent sugar dehydrogenase, partial [Pirellulaceae bacterium]
MWRARAVCRERNQFGSRRQCCLSFEPLESRLPLAVPALHAEPVANLSSPVVATHAGDGSERIFIAEQAGLIRIVDQGAVVPTPFLDLGSRVVAGGERGLLGLAFHPDFATEDATGEGLFYVYYSAPATMGGDHDTVVAEYSVSGNDPNRADIASERIVLQFNQPFGNHNGGDLKFGPDDGLLYISSGDGGSGGDPQGNGQSLGTLLGKILRIDVDSGDDFPDDPVRNYSIPPNNPFANDPGARSELFAFGLRNPFRMSFDDGPNGAASPDRLFVGDVGQNLFEEVDLVTAGGNYGWNVCEADHVFGNASQPCPPGFIKPIAEYGRDVGNSVIGGHVYRGSQSPQLSGVYIFGDLNGTLLALEEQAGNFTLSEVAVSGVVPTSIIGFGEDESGELYVLTFSQMLSLREAAADFGDAPASYGVTRADNGASHVAIGPRLGTQRDAEPDGQPTANASGDDANGVDDEDGVFATASIVATGASVTKSSFSVSSSSSAKLDAWIDFNRDGDWDDAGEQIMASVNVAAGANLLSFNVPAGATGGNTFARFRISTTGGLAPTGAAEDGEVEDYLVSILDGDLAGGVSAEVNAPFPGAVDLVADGNDVVARRGATEL